MPRAAYGYAGLEAGELIEKALDKARDDACLEHPDIVDTTWSKRQADAFVTLLKEYLAGNGEENPGRPDHYLINIHVDQAALAGEAGRSSLPIESVKRLCCDGSAVVITEENGQPLSIGRKTRVVPKAIERAVRSRDGHRCVFPGCRNRRFLDCHHVEHWSNGGETSVDNLVLLCTQDMVDADMDGPALLDPPAGGLLSMAERYALEPPPPAYRH